MPLGTRQLTKPELEDYAAKVRWEKETGGATFNGMAIPTDDRAKTLIEGAAEDLQDSETTSFKVNGNWATLDGITMRAVRTALRTHIKACFALEASLSADIQSGDVTTKAEIDNAAWPS